MKKIAVHSLLSQIIFLSTNVSLAHDVLSGGAIVNPQSLSADRDNAKLNFLASQANRHGVSADQVAAARSVYYAAYVWTKTDLRVCFWNGSDVEQREVMNIADVWHQAVPNVTFNFIDNGNVRICKMSDLSDFHRMSDIRISLRSNEPRAIYNKQDRPASNGDWAYPGRSVAQNKDYPTTMNLVGAMKLRQANMLSDYYFNVRHEFGHALALTHEHQRGICKGWFNIKAIASSQGWSEAYAESQIDSIDESSNAYGIIGGYDNQSIMQYNFSPAWYMPDKPGMPNPCRRKNEVDDLSDLDKVVVAQLYEPTLNDAPERKRLISTSQENSRRLAIAWTFSPSQAASSQVSSITAALASFTPTVKKPSNISIQIYPHKSDQDVVISSVANLGYPITDRHGNSIRTISRNVNKTLTGDPTNAVLYTSDVSDQDVRYVALKLIEAGIEIKCLEPYYPSKQNNFTVRHDLIQIGADVNNRNRRPLTVEDVLSKPLPIYGVSD